MSICPGGLMWFTLDQCMPVVTCLKLDTTANELKIERRNIVVIKDFAQNTDTTCPNTPLTSCSG